MSINNKHISIPKNITTNDDMDFQFLKEKGIEYIENMGSTLWTDFNEHDPGITILEMLSYAITDLGMRINQPINKLLASEETLKSIKQQFYKASDIFPVKPVSELDYRKLFIDIDGVNNCWLKPYTKTVYVNCKDDEISYNADDFKKIPKELINSFVLKGLYSVLVDYDESIVADKIEVIESRIKEKYHENRNLGEDLIEIITIEDQPIKVCGDIEVEANANEEYIEAQIRFAIENYFSPSVQFYSIAAMLKKGFSTDQIFEGPLLNNGFINSQELSETELKREIRLSDLINIIMSIDGVKVINDISINQFKSFDNDGKLCKKLIKSDNDWTICIVEGKKPKLCKDSTFNFKKGILPLNTNKSKVTKYYNEIVEEAKEAQIIEDKDKRLSVPFEKEYSFDSYTTIQNDFPETYGIGQNGLSARATIKRKSQAKQLKAYLLFFDQILASYFKHLGKVKELLSVNSVETKTLFTQVIKDIKGFEELINDYPLTNDSDLSDKLLKSFDDNIKQSNQILDHLIARFAERFGEYTFIMKTIYGSKSEEIVLKNKKDFIKDYKSISSERGVAFNYYRQTPSNLWNTDNISGVQKRIARLMGIKNADRRNLINPFTEIYNLAKDDEKAKYRWRVRDIDNNIILSASTNYQHVYMAKKELDFALLQIQKTNKDQITAAFKNPIPDETVIGNFLIQKAPESGDYSFDIINRDEETDDIDYIIARQYTYYNTTDKLKEALLHILDFINNQYFEEEGIFVLEHILLRPNVDTDIKREEITYLPICKDSCKNICDLDPYSYKVTIVLPGYTFRFSNPDFRKYMEQIIREEFPAHILPKICWVGDVKGVVPDDENDLLNFENSLKDYLIEIAREIPIQDQLKAKLEKLIQSLSKLNTIYPTASLLDCEDESDNIEGKIILGQTSLGTINVNSTKSNNDNINK